MLDYMHWNLRSIDNINDYNNASVYWFQASANSQEPNKSILMRVKGVYLSTIATDQIHSIRFFVTDFAQGQVSLQSEITN